MTRLLNSDYQYQNNSNSKTRIPHVTPYTRHILYHLNYRTINKNFGKIKTHYIFFNKNSTSSKKIVNFNQSKFSILTWGMYVNIVCCQSSVAYNVNLFPTPIFCIFLYMNQVNP